MLIYLFYRNFFKNFLLFCINFIAKLKFCKKLHQNLHPPKLVTFKYDKNIPNRRNKFINFF